MDGPDRNPLNCREKERERERERVNSLEISYLLSRNIDGPDRDPLNYRLS
jgi:hypothetical protein